MLNSIHFRTVKGTHGFVEPSNQLEYTRFKWTVEFGGTKQTYNSNNDISTKHFTGPSSINTSTKTSTTNERYCESVT